MEHKQAYQYDLHANLHYTNKTEYPILGIHTKRIYPIIMIVTDKTALPFAL